MELLDLEALLTASPFHRWLGVRLLREESGLVEILLPYRAEFSGDDHAPYIHGGVIAALIDLSACFALMQTTQRDVPTLDLRVDYLRMAGPNTDLTAVARTIKAGRTTGLADVEVRAADGRLIALGRTTVVTQAAGRDSLTGLQNSEKR